MNETDHITAVVESWRRAWEATDAEALKALWAQTHPHLTYQPTEVEAPLTSFAQISDYYDGICAVLRPGAWRIWDVVVDVLSPETAFVFALSDALIRISDGEFAGDHYWQGRASFVMIKEDGAWKIAHYEDSTMQHHLVPVAQKIQRPSLEKCISLVRTGESEQCITLLQQLLEPIPRADLSRANRPWSVISGIE